MRVIVAYTRVVQSFNTMIAPPQYDAGMKRFLDSYCMYEPPEKHELVIIGCGGLCSEALGLPYSSIAYYGKGWDCGAFQHAANALDCDLLVCCNSWVHFWRSDWLRPMIKAREVHGPGLYGFSASYELGPHLRTPCFGFAPEVVRSYPVAVRDRTACNGFEAGPLCLTKHAERNHYPTLLITPRGALPQLEWRKPVNGFRRGDQSDVLVWDRHTEHYAQASEADKRKLEHYADTL